MYNGSLWGKTSGEMLKYTITTRDSAPRNENPLVILGNDILCCLALNNVQNVFFC